jgi:hypothetical protein
MIGCPPVGGSQRSDSSLDLRLWLPPAEGFYKDLMSLSSICSLVWSMLLFLVSNNFVWLAIDTQSGQA